MTTPPPRPFGRAGYGDIASYTPDPRPCTIDLSDNTNLWGSPPSAERAIRESPSLLARYPEPYSESLKVALADYAGVRPEMIVTGCGSDDVLDSALRASAEPGETIALVDPTFVMIPQLARSNGLEMIRIPISRDADVDVARLTAARAAITYVCSPNNPTGRSVRREDIEAVVAAAPGVVIIDEAYFEFQEHSFVEFAMRSERVLVARTMSKAFGLAGARVGYGIGSPSLIAEIEKARGPFKVAGHAADAAIAALTNDRVWVRDRVADAIASRGRFIETLRAMGLEPLESRANFVFVPVAGAVAIAAAMRRRDVAVRPFTNVPAFGDALRMTVGPWKLMETVIAALQEAVDECA